MDRQVGRCQPDQVIAGGGASGLGQRRGDANDRIGIAVDAPQHAQGLGRVGLPLRPRPQDGPLLVAPARQPVEHIEEAPRLVGDVAAGEAGAEEAGLGEAERPSPSAIRPLASAAGAACSAPSGIRPHAARAASGCPSLCSHSPSRSSTSPSPGLPLGQPDQPRSGRGESLRSELRVRPGQILAESPGLHRADPQPGAPSPARPRRTSTPVGDAWLDSDSETKPRGPVEPATPPHVPRRSTRHREANQFSRILLGCARRRSRPNAGFSSRRGPRLPVPPASAARTVAARGRDSGGRT